LQDYKNQLVWDRLDRTPPLDWLKSVVAAKQPENPYDAFGASPILIRDATSVLLSALENAAHIIAVAPALFSFEASSDSKDFLSRRNVECGRRLAAWLAGGPGRRMELALAQPPAFSAESSEALAIWYEATSSLQGRQSPIIQAAADV
jgi:hypothetical protein